jgi:hypothetical protein
MISNPTGQADELRASVFDRPGGHEVARLKAETTHTIDALDSPADLLAQELKTQVDRYFEEGGEIPASRERFSVFVVEQFRSAAGPTAVSAMLENFIATDEITHMANMARRMLVIIRGQARPALTCDALAIAFGMHIGEGRSLEEIAKSHGITKQALSKRAIRICNELGLQPSPLMRSVKSRDSYRIKQRQRHAAARQAGLGLGSIEELRTKLAAAREHVSGNQLKRMTA